MSTFMLLFRAPKHLAAQPRSREQERASGERWRSWDRALRAAGHLVTGAQLQSTGCCVAGADPVVVDGTFGIEFILDGYFVVTAESLAQATELAKGCPVLQNGGTVKVRPYVGEE